MNEDLTLDVLKEYVSYDPLTGVFMQIKKTHSRDNKRKLNEPLGYKDGRGYIHFSLFGKKYKAHRLAWLYVHGKLPPEFIDHIDGNRTNNKISNLRLANNSENQTNRRVILSASGYKGVYPTGKGRWMAQYNKIHLGCFDDPRDAADTYDKYVVEMFGDFAATNGDILNGKE